MRLISSACAALAAGMTLALAGAAAAEEAPDVRSLAADAAAAPATLADLKGLVGDWTAKGAVAGFSAPAAGTIVGHLALFTDKGPRVYEMWIIRQEGDTLLVRQKHYTPPDLKDREDKDSWSQRQLVALTPGHIYFDNLTFVTKGQTLGLVVRIPGQDGAAPTYLTYDFERAN